MTWLPHHWRESQRVSEDRSDDSKGNKSVISKVRLAGRVAKQISEYLHIYRLVKNVEFMVIWAWYQLTWGRKPYVSYIRHRVSKRANLSQWYAVGSTNRDSWLYMGDRLFQYLVSQGLRPEDKLLDIGCGNLRVGLRLIDYLNSGNYWGIDISSENLETGREFLAEWGVKEKRPHLSVNDDLKFEQLLGQEFDVVFAHSVFTHTPEATIEECLVHLRKVLKPSGVLFATYNEGSRRFYHRATGNFWYPLRFFESLCHEHGYSIAVDQTLVHHQGQTMMIFRPSVPGFKSTLAETTGIGRLV